MPWELMIVSTAQTDAHKVRPYIDSPSRPEKGIKP